MPKCYNIKDNKLILRVLLQPGASKDEIVVNQIKDLKDENAVVNLVGYAFKNMMYDVTAFVTAKDIEAINDFVLKIRHLDGGHVRDTAWWLIKDVFYIRETPELPKYF